MLRPLEVIDFNIPESYFAFCFQDEQEALAGSRLAVPQYEAQGLTPPGMDGEKDSGNRS